MAAASHRDLLLRGRSHPLFIPITAAPVCSSQDMKPDILFVSKALPSLIQARPFILMATFAHSIDNVLWKNVTVCILDGFKALTPKTRGLATAWEALSVILRPYTTTVSCYSKDGCIVAVTFKQLLYLQAVRVLWIGLKKLYQIVFGSLLAQVTVLVTYSLLLQPLCDVVSKTYGLGGSQVCCFGHRIENQIS